MDAWEVHRFTVTTRASLASALTSFGTEHALKDNRALLNPTLRASTPTTGEQTSASDRAFSHGTKRGPHPTSSAGSGHHNTNHTHQQGANGHHTLRKDMAGIYTKNSPYTKNIGLTQSTQGCSHIKTPLQDHSR